MASYDQQAARALASLEDISYQTALARVRSAADRLVEEQGMPRGRALRHLRDAARMKAMQEGVPIRSGRARRRLAVVAPDGD